MFEKYLAVIIIFILVLSGCTKDNPVENSALPGTDDRTLINLPRVSGEQVEASFYASSYINGKTGGEVLIDKEYNTSSGIVKIFARIKFKPDSFTGSKLIKMMIDDVNGTISFDPPSVFSRPADLDMKFEGIDLSRIDRNKANFVYVNPNGAFEPFKYKSMILDIQRRLLEVRDAEINHFSRYGFCR